MNGARSTYMRKGYLLTALAAAVLLAASSGTAWAQSVTIGFVGTSGDVSEKASLDVNSEADPQRITVRVSGLSPGARRDSHIDRSLGDVTITTPEPVYIARVTASGAYAGGAENDQTTGAAAPLINDGLVAANAAFTIDASHFSHDDEVVLAVAQSEAGSGDTNWLEEMVALHLEVDDAATSPASVNPDIFTVTFNESHVAPVAEFKQPDFTLSEESERTVELDIVRAGASIPGALAAAGSPYTDMISVRVSNRKVVVLTIDGVAVAPGTLTGCPDPTDARNYNSKVYHVEIGATDTGSTGWTQENFANTGVLQTVAPIGGENGLAGTGDAKLVITGCGDKKGIIDPRITLTILPSGLSESRPAIGDITIGAPLTISTDSDEALPTLSFSPTDVTIDEGGETSTVLVAEGKNAGDVKMVKLSIEGDAMVSLMQDGEMLEEMNGHVYVDLGGSSAARLMAMSHSDPDLMDGDMAFKAWKLMEGAAEGVNIGEGYWFKVDVRGSTAVPALPLLGQLLLALFLMAGGARLYRRRQG